MPAPRAPVDLETVQARAVRFGLAGPRATICPGEPVKLDVLIDALDAWKQGTAVTLAKRKPPIRLADDDQRAGAKLLEYQLLKPDEPIKNHASTPVRIKISRGSGAPPVTQRGSPTLACKSHIRKAACQGH